MSNRKYRIPAPKPTCWNCARLKKSKRDIEIKKNPENEDGFISCSISGNSVLDCIAGYYCCNYWFGDKPDETEMLCGGREYKRRY